MRSVGGSCRTARTRLFTVTESLQIFADDTPAWNAGRWRTGGGPPTAGRRTPARRACGSPSTASSRRSWTRRERRAAIEDAPLNPRTGARQWTPDGVKRVVGQRVERPVQRTCLAGRPWPGRRCGTTPRACSSTAPRATTLRRPGNGSARPPPPWRTTAARLPGHHPGLRPRPSLRRSRPSPAPIPAAGADFAGQSRMPRSP